MMASKFPSATAKSMDDLAALNDDHVRDMVEQLLVDDGGDGSNTAKPSDAIDPTNNKSGAPKTGDDDASPGGFLVTSGGLPQAPLSGSPNGQHQHSMPRGGHQQPVDNWSFASCPPMFAVCHGGPRDISPGTVTPPPQRSAHSTSPGYQPGQPGQLGVSFDVAGPEFGNNGSFPSGPVGGYRGASPAPQPHHPHGSQSAQSQGQSGHSQSQPQPAACTTSEGVTVLPLDKRLFEIPRVKSAQPDNAASLVKLFVGNMRFEMTREALRWVLHQASGIHIPLTHILVHVRAASSAGHVSTGCASVFVPEHEAEALLAMNQRIFCNSHSLYLAPSTHAMSRMIDERQILDHDHKGRKLRGPKNSMVIERSKSTPTPSQFTTPNNSFATMFSMGESPMHSTNASFANPFSSPGGLVMGGTPQSSHGNLTQLGFGASGTDYYGGGGGGTRSPGFGGFEGPGTHGYGHHQDAVAAAMAAHGHDSSSAGSPNGAHAYAHGHDSSPNGPTSTTGAGAGDDDAAEVEGKDGRGKSGSPPMPQDAPNYERYPISLDQPSTTGAKISDAVELFIGGIRYEATASFVAWMLRAAVKRVSGNIVEIHPDHVTLFTNSKKKRNNNAGCALVKVERAHAEGLLALNHCILCDAYGAYYATTEDSMTKFIHAYHGKVRGGPSHAVVIETRKNVVNNARQGNAGAFGAAFGVRTFGAGFAQHGGGGAGGPASTGGVNASAASFTPGAGGASGVPSGAPSFDHNGGSAAAHSANGGPAVGASGINWSASAQNAHAGVSPGGGGGGGSVSWNPAWVPVYQGGGAAGSSPNEGHHHHLGQGQAPAVPQLVPAAAAGGGSPLGLQSQSLSTNASFTGATVAATAAASTTIMGAAPPPPSYRSEAASSPSPDAKKKKAEEE